MVLFDVCCLTSSGDQLVSPQLYVKELTSALDGAQLILCSFLRPTQPHKPMANETGFLTSLKSQICDWACENRAYLHTKFGLIFEIQLTISYEVQTL